MFDEISVVHFQWMVKEFLVFEKKTTYTAMSTNIQTWKIHDFIVYCCKLFPFVRCAIPSYLAIWAFARGFNPASWSSSKFQNKYHALAKMLTIQRTGKISEPFPEFQLYVCVCVCVLASFLILWLNIMVVSFAVPSSYNFNLPHLVV